MQHALTALITLVLVASSAAGAEPEFTVGLGYGKLLMPANKDNNMHERDGARFDFRFTVPVSEDLEPLRLGGGLTLSGYNRWQDEEAFIIIDDEVYLIDADSFESVSLIVPEFLITWQQPLGDNGWYVEPGVAAGLMIGTYSTGTSSGWFWDYDEYETDLNASIRPHVRLGYSNSDGYGGWVVGGELSYLWGGRLDFDQAGDSDIQEFYLGVYGGVRF